jgi:hypothetical protein
MGGPPMPPSCTDLLLNHTSYRGVSESSWKDALFFCRKKAQKAQKVNPRTHASIKKYTIPSNFLRLLCLFAAENSK